VENEQTRAGKKERRGTEEFHPVDPKRGEKRGKKDRFQEKEGGGGLPGTG